MQLTWGRHQEATYGGWRWSEGLEVLPHPWCAHAQVAPPRDRLPHGGCMLGLDSFSVGFGSRFAR
jgi:hypothetical protein